MNWLYKYLPFLLLHVIQHAQALQADIHTVDPGDFKQPTFEVPKPMSPEKFEELDSEYKIPRKLSLKVLKTAKSRKPSLIDVALQVAAKEGLDAMTDLYQNIEPEIARNGQLLEDNHPAALLSKFSAPTEDSQQSAMAAFATIVATKAFRRNYKESTVLGRQAQSQKVSFRRTPLEGLCPPRELPQCMPAAQRYRTHDGTCNNRRRPRWGSAQMPFNRFLPPEYGDGVDSIRGSVEGGSLSSARFVSLLVHGAREGDAPLTLMIAQWGQLLDHDLTSTAQPRSINGSVPSCCGSNDFHPSCFPIKVPLDDPWLAPLKVRCLEFLRSAPAQRRDCVLSWREQTNQVTSFVDASPIYSSNAKTSDNARIFRNGMLVFGRGNPADDVCMRGAIAHQCIRSGDGRSGEQPGLLALHHVWVGEHNRIAAELSNLNPHWSDEKVYQETRRIIGALFQHITYREFLPIVLGREVCKLFDIELRNSGYYSGYDPNTNPSVSNSFAAAAFRFGHSLVQNSYMRCDRHHNFINNNVTLHEEFQQGDIGTAGSLHRLLRGLATQRALKRDEFITPELTNHLFQTPGFPFGLDLAAINIQRGRDHGIAPYTAWRKPCGLTPITSWDDLSNVVGSESAKRISHAYRNVHDIDLFVGGIAERPVVGGLVGPTFACIIAQQFSNSRKGDRFWYENPGFESSFTPAQLHSLRHVSLSSILCRAVGGGTFQPHVFIPSDVTGNARVECGEDPLAPVDLRPWLEMDPFLMTSQQKLDSPAIHDQHTAIQVSKEDMGINNQLHNMTMVTHVDFIPNGSIGFHRVPNMTNIHDKLDMDHKLVTRPMNKLFLGINNKLDKGRLSLKKNPNPTVKRHSTTTRRTVIIHNVEIELRNAAAMPQKSKKKKTDRDMQQEIASAAQNTILKVAGLVRSQMNAAIDALEPRKIDEKLTQTSTQTDSIDTTDNTDATTNLAAETAPQALIQYSMTEQPQTTPKQTSMESYNAFQAIIDSALQKPTDQFKRVHRNTEYKHFKVGSVELTTHLDFNDKLRTLKLDTQTPYIGRHLSSDPLHIPLEPWLDDLAPHKPYPFNTTETDNSSADYTGTLRNVELRQPHERPIYNRPDKLIVDGPNADQYEIEINIRQTNSKLPTGNSHNVHYNNADKRYDSDQQNVYDYSQTQSQNYYTQATRAPYGTRTKPPTIIYINELDEQKTTTSRPPGFFQNIISFATNGFNGKKPNAEPSNSPFYQNPNRVIGSGGQSPTSSNYLGSSQVEHFSHLSPTSGNYLSSQQVQPFPLFQNYPQPGPSSFNPIGGLPPPQVFPPQKLPGANSFSTASNNDGIAHASSSAVSTGHFGAIVGQASSSGSDSTFSFNIRPSAKPQPNLVSPTGIKPNYELIPPRRTSPYSSTQSYANPPKPMSAAENFHYPPNRQDPFSSHTRRPKPPYYNERPTNIFDPAYDDLGRSELKVDEIGKTNNKTNSTKEEDDFDSAEYDYNDDDNTHESDNDIEIEEEKEDEQAEKFDKDGYLRPEHMVANLYKHILTNKTDLNATKLDDNFVLPKLRQDEHFKELILTYNTTTNVTSFPDTEQKSLSNDILAEDYDDLLTERTSFSTTRSSGRGNKRRRPSNNLQVAFAPIKILTEPERPDNWVIFNMTEEKPQLPVLPDYNTETLVADEVPMPFDEVRVRPVATSTTEHTFTTDET